MTLVLIRLLMLLFLVVVVVLIVMIGLVVLIILIVLIVLIVLIIPFVLLPLLLLAPLILVLPLLLLLLAPLLLLFLLLLRALIGRSILVLFARWTDTTDTTDPVRVHAPIHTFDHDIARSLNEKLLLPFFGTHPACVRVLAYVGVSVSMAPLEIVSGMFSISSHSCVGLVDHDGEVDVSCEAAVDEPSYANHQ